MKAKADPEFLRRFNELPARIQELARKNYAIWQVNPFIHHFSSSKPAGGYGQPA